MSAIRTDDAARAAVMERLSSEAAVCVLLGLARLSPTAPRSLGILVTLSSHAPMLFSANLSDLEHSYNLWIAMPIPPEIQLSGLRQTLDNRGNSNFRSLKVVSKQVAHYFPLWILGYWARLRTLALHCISWEQSIEWLERQATGPGSKLAVECLSLLSSLPLDLQIPKLSPFSTSYLPTLLGNHWLTDDHINAGVDYINSHPELDPKMRLLNSYFMSTLQLDRRRRTTRSSTSIVSSSLDLLLSKRQITQLLIPIHRPSHWTLLLIDISAMTYTYFDSLCPERYNAPSICIGPLNDWLSDVLNTESPLLPISSITSLDRQNDSHSCGVAVLSTMAHVALGRSFHPWNQATSGEERMQWALRFIGEATLWDMLSNQPNISMPNQEPEDSTLQWGTSTLSDLESPPSASSSSNVDEMSDSGRSTGMDIDSSSMNAQHAIQGTLSQAQGRLIQTTLPFKSIPLDQWNEQQAQRHDRNIEERQQDRNRLVREALRKKTKRREYERLKKKAQRERKKKGKSSAATEDVQRPKPPTGSSVRVAEASRPGRAFKEAMRTAKVRRVGRKRIHAARNARRVNWSAPFIWNQIHNAAVAVGQPWRPTEIVQRLQHLDSETFATLRPQRISQWRDHSCPDILKWTDAHLRTVSQGHQPHSASTRVPILSEHQDLVTVIEKRLGDLRDAGVALSVSYMRGYIAGVLRHHAPDLFKLADKNGRLFDCSETWIRSFLRKIMGWSRRKATRAAQKLPPNLHKVLLQSFLRLACLIRDDDIPACCIVNADQTQVVYNMGCDITWAPTGIHQVAIVGVEDKRALTLLQSISMSGDVLPFQAIYVGKSSRSLPERSTPSFDTALNLGFLIESSCTKTYWSTQDTMRSFVSLILVPYFRQQIALHNLPSTQRCVFQLDCWSVHRSKEFLTWISTTYPWIVLHFIPGGCTGVFQACDTTTQRVVKLAMRRAAHEDLVNETSEALASGTSPSDVVNDQTVKTLRNRSVRWLLEGYNAINNPRLIKKAFELCAVPETEFNLSYESLTSREARQALSGLRSTDPEFYQEIMSGHSEVPSGKEEDEEPDFEDDEIDADCTLPELIKQVLSTAKLDELPGSSRNVDEQSDGYESEEYGYSAPVYLAAPCA